MDSLVCDDAYNQLLHYLQQEQDIDLLAAIILIAQGAGQEFEVENIYNEIELLALQLKKNLRDIEPISLRVQNLCKFMKHEAGFVGNLEDYYNPDNSYINQLLSTRKGIPIALAGIYLILAEAAELPIEGVGFPGHFLVREMQTGLLIDPFEHQIVTRRSCQKKLTLLFGEQAEMKESYLLAVDNKQIVVRMLRNLKGIYKKEKQYNKALNCCHIIMAAEGDEQLELFDRAYFYEKLECYSAAIEDLEQYIKRYPDDKRIKAIEQRLSKLKSNSAYLVH